MRRFARLALLALLATAPACSAVLHFHQCDTDADCQAHADGGTLYCTTDHACVGAVPAERLCPETVAAPGARPPLVLMSLVDRSDPLDQGIEKAFRLAVDEINALQPGGNQPGLELHVCDQGTTLDGSQSLAAVKYASDHFHVAAVLGPTATADVVAVTPFARDNGVLVITPSATSIAIDALDSQRMVWRTAPSDALEAMRLSAVVQADMPTRLDILYADSLDNTTLEQAFYTAYTQNPAFTVHQAFEFMEGGTDLSTVIPQIGTDQPSGLVVVSDSDNPAILAGIAAQPNLGAMKIYMTNAAKAPSLLDPKLPASLYANLKGTGPATPSGATFGLFEQAYLSQWGVDPKDSNFSANAYDAAYLVAIAAAATTGHVPTGRELSTGMQMVLSTGTALRVGSTDYLQAVAAMQSGGVRLSGASGPLEFGVNGAVNSGTYEVWGVDDTSGTPTFVTLP